MPRELKPRSKFASTADNLIEWASRAIAVLVLMVLPGFLGFWLERSFGWKYLGAIGFAIGTLFGIAGLILVVTKMDASRKTNSATKESQDHDASSD